MTPALLAGLLAGYAIAIPVGGIAAYLLTLTARTSWTVGAAAALGVASVDALYALVAVVAGAAAGAVVEPVAGPLRWLAVAVLGILALRLAARSATVAPANAVTDPTGLPSPTNALGPNQALAPSKTADPSSAPNPSKAPGPARAFGHLAGLTLINPATVSYFAALVIGARATSNLQVIDEIAFVLGVFLASASWQLTLACGGALLGRYFTSRRGHRMLGLTSAVVIGLLAVRLALTG